MTAACELIVVLSFALFVIGQYAVLLAFIQKNETSYGQLFNKTVNL